MTSDRRYSRPIFRCTNAEGGLTLIGGGFDGVVDALRRYKVVIWTRDPLSPQPHAHKLRRLLREEIDPDLRAAMPRGVRLVASGCGDGVLIVTAYPAHLDEPPEWWWERCLASAQGVADVYRRAFRLEERQRDADQRWREFGSSPFDAPSCHGDVAAWLAELAEHQRREWP